MRNRWGKSGNNARLYFFGAPRSLHPFGNDFVYGIRSELTFKLLNLDNEFFPSSFLKAAFPQLNDLGNLVKDHLTIYARVYF